MSITSDYTFYKMGRLGGDWVDVTQRNMQNTTFSNYVMDNNNANNDDYITFASAIPNVNYTGVNGGSSVGARRIVTDNELKIKNIEQARDVGQPMSLHHSREHVTMPYLGRGSVDPDIQSQMMYGEMTSIKKSDVNMSEDMYVKYGGDNYPLLQKTRQHIDGYDDALQDYTNKGWVRGGGNTRL